MSIFLRRLLPDAPWVIAAIAGDDKVVRTFRADHGEFEKDRAFDWMREHSGHHFRVLAGRPKQMLSSVPRIEHVAEVHAIGIHTDPGQAKALRSLQKPPALTYQYQGRFIAVWRFTKPAAPDKADEAEQMLADKFKGGRLNFFVPIPRDATVEDANRATIDIKDIAALAPAPIEEEDEELSANCAPTQRAFAIEPIAQRGAITLISGDAGMGKSQIALDIAMRVTRGVGLPDHPAPTLGAVLCCEEEDDWKSDVIPRLIANGANRKLIKGIRAQDLHTERGVNRLTDIKARFEKETGLPVLMLILSPYMACFGGGSNQEVHMREKLKHISTWAKRSGVAVLGVAHLDEGGVVAGPKTHRRLARASWKVIEDEDTGQRLFVCDKANNTPDDFKLAYRIQGVKIEGGIRTSKIVWEDIDISTQATSRPPSPQGKTDKAESLIRDLLQSGDIDSAELRKLVLAEGVSVGAFLDAKKRVFGEHGTRGKKVTLSQVDIAR